MLSWQSLLDGWCWFFFTPESPITLAVFRILFGLLLVANGLTMLSNAEMWYGVDGVFPMKAYLRRYRKLRFSLLHFLPKCNASMFVVFGIYFIASIGVILGLCTTLCSILVFLTLVSLHTRNGCVLSGCDVVIRMMSFLLIFSNSGAAFSLDRMIGWADHTGQNLITPWCTRLMQIQVAVIYLRTAWWKVTGESWQNGSAAYYAMSLKEFKRFGLPSLLNHVLVFKLATWSALVVEFALGTLIWIREVRLPMVVAGILMHLGFEYFLNVELFSFTMMVCLVLFIPPENMVSMLQYLHFL